MAITLLQGGGERLIPEVVQVSPMHEINSTAYAAKLTYKFEDSLHSSVVICKKEENDPIPTKVSLTQEQLSNEMDIEPHFSMEWTNRKIQTPGQGRLRATVITTAEKIL